MHIVSAPQGVLAVYMMGGPTYFWELKIYTISVLFGTRDLFFGLEKIGVFVFGLASVDQKIINLNSFSATCEFQVLVFFGV